MIELTPELIEVFGDIVAAMNGTDTENYLDLYLAAGGLPDATFVPLSVYLAQVIGSNYRGIQYYPGHPLEIRTTLQQKDETSFKYEKYPAVCLFLDVREIIGRRAFALQATTLQILFLSYTEPEYTALQRHEHNFKPILLPMYYEFMHQIVKNKVINDSAIQNIPRDKINHYFWSRDENQTANPFTDYLDALELQNLQLNFNLKNCLNNGKQI